jgi:hypothetical protein
MSDKFTRQGKRLFITVKNLKKKRKICSVCCRLHDAQKEHRIHILYLS